MDNKPCDQFVALVNHTGSYLGTVCCTCGHKETDHKKGEREAMSHKRIRHSMEPDLALVVTFSLVLAVLAVVFCFVAAMNNWR